ncbi:MAG: 3-isopropylmalate dehydratase [Ardenticatenaceae bacterium]|nr:3-isopropylmalate dehydratase [Ardenticatenaceae bacterium]
MSRVWKFGSDVDTDQIVPGRYAPFMLKEGQDVKDYAFIEARPDFARNARPGDVIVAGKNFGCGSSREYAPEALRRRQIGGIIAVSYARIFFRNAINLGIPVIEAPDVVDALEDGMEIEVKWASGQLKSDSGQLFELPPMPAFATEIIAAGGLTAFVRKYGRFPGEK